MTRGVAVCVHAACVAALAGAAVGAAEDTPWHSFVLCGFLMGINAVACIFHLGVQTAENGEDEGDE
jgi:hypothetical protein